MSTKQLIHAFELQIPLFRPSFFQLYWHLPQQLFNWLSQQVINLWANNICDWQLLRPQTVKFTCTGENGEPVTVFTTYKRRSTSKSSLTENIARGILWSVYRSYIIWQKEICKFCVSLGLQFTKF